MIMSGMWPWQATWTQRTLRRIEDKLDRLLHETRVNRREELERDYIEMATQEEVLEKIRQTTDFSQATNTTIREVLKLLREGQSDPAKNAEAIALLEKAQADDLAILKENTPEETPSGQ